MLAVEVRQLSKRYRRGAISVRSLRDELELLWSYRTGAAPKSQMEQFYALEDVTFSVPKGSICGIIGRNGSGKTTILKILASITLPESGEAILHGRVGSLLEVGAGFHPELDGLENIFLYGAILGMSRKEIASKLDQIISFADVGPVLETPVKRYSSGMYVRLAFAVAAHLDPDILLVDEVLAVGDAEFQRKSIGKMKDATKEGRTILFVSHNMAMVRQLCNMAVYLDRGKLKRVGEVASIVDAYLADVSPSPSGPKRVGTDELWADLSIYRADSAEPAIHLHFGGDYDFVLRLYAKTILNRCVAVVRICDQQGELISSLVSLAEGVDQFDIVGSVDVLFKIRSLVLLPGTYIAGIAVFAWGEDNPTLSADNVLSFDIVPAMVNGAHWNYLREHGVVRVTDSAQLRVRS